jgi:hypothetical protein
LAKARVYSIFTASVIALVASLAVAGLAAGQAPGESPPPGEAPPPPPGEAPPPPPGGPAGTFCATDAGPVRIAALWARRPGGGWENALANLCPSLRYMEQPDPTGGATIRSASFFFSPGGGPTTLPEDLSSAYPPGTEMSLELEASIAPLAAGGAIAEPLASFEAAKITVQGRTTQIKFAFGGDCSSATTLRSFFGGGVLFEPVGSGRFADELRSYRGAFFGTNAMQHTMPQVSPDGRALNVTVEGCGDGDPTTEEGFFTGFIPSKGTAEMGLSQPLLKSLSDKIADQLMELKDNGATEPDAGFEVASQRDVQLDPTPGASTSKASAVTPAGVTVDYRLSFSEHKLSTTSNRKKIRTAKTCRARKGKLAVVRRGTGRKAKKTLACIVKKKRKRA